MKSFLIPLATLAMATSLGCGGGAVYTFEPTGTPQAAKAAPCEFAVAATVPDGHAYEEIGVLDARRIPSRNLTTFKTHARPTVCHAGGDLVVAQVNGDGFYVRAIVFRRITREATPAPPTGATRL